MFPPICIKVNTRNDYEPVITPRNDTKTENTKLGSAAYFALEEVQTNMKKKVTLFFLAHQ